MKQCQFSNNSINEFIYIYIIIKIYIITKLKKINWVIKNIKKIFLNLNFKNCSMKYKESRVTAMFDRIESAWIGRVSWQGETLHVQTCNRWIDLVIE